MKHSGRKLLSIFCAFVLFFTLMQGMVKKGFAENYIAKVTIHYTTKDPTTTQYDNLHNALQYALTQTEQINNQQQAVPATIQLLDDITYASGTWNPVEFPVSHKLTFDGNYKTITNLPGMMFNKTGSGVKGLIMYNVTFKSPKAEVTGDYGAVIMGYADSVGELTFTNVHIDNATVKSNNYVGAFYGYASGYNVENDGPIFAKYTIKDCSVTNSNFKGGGSAGTLIGHAAGNPWTKVIISNTVVSGNTIEGQVIETGNDPKEKEGILIGTLGVAKKSSNNNGDVVDGGVWIEATESGNTLVHNKGHEIGRIGSSGGTGIFTVGGSYTVNPLNTYDPTVGTIKPEEGYSALQLPNGTWTIGKGVTIIANNQTIKYGESVSSNVDKVTVSSDYAGDFTLESIVITPDTTDATDKGVLTPKDAKLINNNNEDVTANYVLIYLSGDLIISKIASSVTTEPAGRELYYTGSAQELITAGEASGGTMYYAIGTDSTTAPEFDSTAIPTATNPGTYYVWYKSLGDKNHTDTTPACITTRIYDALPTIADSAVTVTQGKTATLAIEDSTGSGTRTWTVNSTASWVSIVKDSDSKATLTVSPTSSVAAGTYTCEITVTNADGKSSTAKITIKVEADTSGSSIDDNGKEQEPGTPADNENKSGGGSSESNNPAEDSKDEPKESDNKPSEEDKNESDKPAEDNTDKPDSPQDNNNDESEEQTSQSIEDYLDSLSSAEKANMTDLQLTNEQKTALTDSELKDIISQLPALETVDLSGCTQITTVDMSGSESLSSLNIEGCENLSDLNLGGCSFLNEIKGLKNSKSLKTLDTSGCSALESLDVSGCSALTSLDCSGGSLENLSVEGCTALETLDCKNNKLDSLNADGCESLTTLECGPNGLNKLSLKGCLNLQKLYCYSNNLESLEVPSQKLEWLVCDDNKLPALNIEENKKLKRLDCQNNSMAALNIDVSVFSQLDWLKCYGQTIADLIVSASGQGYNVNFREYLRANSALISKNSARLASDSDTNNIQGVKAYDKNGREIALLSYDPSTGIASFASSPAKVSYEYKTGYDGITMDVTIGETNAASNENESTTDYDNHVHSSSGGCNSGFGILIIAVTLAFIICMRKNAVYPVILIILVSCAPAFCDVALTADNFPDENFRSYIINELEADINQDGVLSNTEIELVTMIAVHDREIANLTGIEYFTALQELYCYNNELRSLDVSRNRELLLLECDNNKITKLNLTQNNKLINLECEMNNITELNLAQNKELSYIKCYGQTRNNLVSSQDKGSGTYTVELGRYVRDFTKIAGVAAYDGDGKAVSKISFDPKTGIASMSASPSKLRYIYDVKYANNPELSMDVTITGIAKTHNNESSESGGHVGGSSGGCSLGVGVFALGAVPLIFSRKN